jgi:hypothetical protein
LNWLQKARLLKEPDKDMKRVIKKLLLGSNSKSIKPSISPIQRRINNIKEVWNNHHQDDRGIEKIFRLFLSSSQLFFPGIYLKTLASKKGHEYQDLILDLFVLFKVAFPIIILLNNWQHSPYVIYILLYFMLETILYIPTLIFASDSFYVPRSYKRSILLLFLNYMEIVFTYSVLYSYGNYLNRGFDQWFDAVYFGAVTASSVGYGDYFPVTGIGKFFSQYPSFIALIFVVLFLNFFSTRIKSKGYFDHESEELKFIFYY